MRKRIDMIGKKFNHWTVLEKSEKKRKDGIFFWKCRCDCGLEREVSGASLRSGRSKQCDFKCSVLVKKKQYETFDRSYVEDKNGCWIWTGPRHRDGYGKIGYSVPAHRFSYERFKGFIPERICVCHTCDVPSCVNPNHLWLGTQTDNNKDKVEKNRQAYGQRHGMSKVEDEDIIEIRKMRISGKSYREISEKFNLSYSMIRAICKNKFWKHVK